MLTPIRRIIFLTVLAVPMIFPAMNSMAQSDDPPHDMLLYVAINDWNEEATYLLYDPHSGESRPVLTLPQFSRAVAFSADGRLAFSSSFEGHEEGLYVLDVLSEDSEPIQISSTPAYPLAWSPDGRFLAFVTTLDNGLKVIYVWDGETFSNIIPDYLMGHGTIESLSWSFDGRLAFTVEDTVLSASAIDPGEIYLWDGHATTNLSQNPTSYDTEPIWSADGRLAFRSNGEIAVWDGVSLKNGVPNAETFTYLRDQEISFYSNLAWTSDGSLAFGAQGPYDKHIQIYMWDGQTVTNLSHNPAMHSIDSYWSRDGYWAFVTFFSSEQVIYVRDAENRTVLKTQGQYRPSWSFSGCLGFCARSPSGKWALSVWNRQDIFKIGNAYEIRAQWQGSSDYIICSNG